MLPTLFCFVLLGCGPYFFSPKASVKVKSIVKMEEKVPKIFSWIDNYILLGCRSLLLWAQGGMWGSKFGVQREHKMVWLVLAMSFFLPSQYWKFSPTWFCWDVGLPFFLAQRGVWRWNLVQREGKMAWLIPIMAFCLSSQRWNFLQDYQHCFVGILAQPLWSRREVWRGGLAWLLAIVPFLLPFQHWKFPLAQLPQFCWEICIWLFISLFFN